MAHLTEKENLLRCFSGEMPEFLPKYDFYRWHVGIPMFTPDENGVMRDGFGMEYTTSKESMGGYMPVPGKIFLEDITKWRDVVKLPDESGMDWEKVAKEALKDKDTEHDPVIVFNGGYFMTLMNMMGFVDGLCAMIEEPEEVYALFDYISQRALAHEKILIEHFHPDVYSLSDDTAAMQAPFISAETYRELVKPFHQREAELALNAGLKVEMHDCGKCECFIDDWMDMGVCAWNPAQVTNDLQAIKKKYGRKLVICGGWDNQGAISFPETPDEELRQALMDFVDRMAPGGGFAYMASIVGNPGEEVYDRKVKIVESVYQDYARHWYDTHG